MDVSRPARAAVTTGIALLGRRAYVTSSRRRHDCGPVGPGVAGLRIIFALLSLIIKFLGHCL